MESIELAPAKFCLGIEFRISIPVYFSFFTLLASSILERVQRDGFRDPAPLCHWTRNSSRRESVSRHAKSSNWTSECENLFPAKGAVADVVLLR